MTDGGDSNSSQTAQSPPAVQQAVQAQSPQPANQVQMQAAIPAVAPPSDFILLNDEPSWAERDPLDFEDVAGDLADTILRSRRSSPLTLGVEGGWGSGKSTLMRKLARRLDRDPGVAIVWFNAWAAEGNSALEGLIKTVLEEISPRTVRRAARQERVLTAGRAGSMLPGRALGLSGVVDVVWEQVSKDARARNNLRDLLHSAMGQWASKRVRRGLDPLMVVFVDDLDRASPGQIFEVLEAVKLYLDTDGLAFVVGYDQSVISEVVLAEKKYSANVTGRQYLEKIVQVAYRITPPDDDHALALAQAYADESGTSALFDEAALRLMIDRNQRNPRRIKRFLNSFVLLYGLDADWRQFGPKSLLDVLLLDTHFPDFMALFRAGTEGDPVGEFLDYRESWVEIQDGTQPGEDREQAFRELERNLPEQYPLLVRNDEFVALVRTLQYGERWDDLLPKLQRRRSPVVQPASKEVVEPWDLSREVVREPIGWLEQQPRPGVEVLLVESNDPELRQEASLADRVPSMAAWRTESALLSEAELLLHRRRFGVVVVDGRMPRDLEAARHWIARERQGGSLAGPVVFFTPRVTPELRQQLSEIDADIIGDLDELDRHIDGLLQDGPPVRRRAAGSRSGRPDDGDYLTKGAVSPSVDQARRLRTMAEENRSTWAAEAEALAGQSWELWRHPDRRDEAVDSLREAADLYDQLAREAADIGAHDAAAVHHRAQLDCTRRLAEYLEQMGAADDAEEMRLRAEVLAGRLQR